MKTLEIKKAEDADLQQLVSISKQTFFEAFSDNNSAEDMEKYLDNSFSKEKLSGELRNPDSEFYFALHADIVAGYLKINFGSAQTDLKDGDSLEIERIYVLKEFHGQKVGQALFDKALSIARQKKMNYVWLGVWEKNARAIRFYKKNGFVEFDTHIFKLGNDEQTDILMRLHLT
jgi:diamine N-acetyltransferase